MRKSMIAYAAAAMALVMPQLPADPRLPKPPHVRLMDPRARKRADKKRRLGIENERNRLGNRRNRKMDAERSDMQAAINSLTNWQRNQWARAGYPGLKTRRREDIIKFAVVRP